MVVVIAGGAAAVVVVAGTNIFTIFLFAQTFTHANFKTIVIINLVVVVVVVELFW